MKDLLRSILASDPSRPGRSVVREYLQARILEGLQRCGAMIPLAFQGGTALRFLYSIPRYSEDLDFALERSPASYALRPWLRSLESAFTTEGYEVDVKVSDRRTVHGAFLRFRGLLHELGLSGEREEAIAVKIEVDTRPPEGAVLATTLVRRYALLNLQHHDRGSLLAGKLHAVLARPYAKGRDLYDLLWYLSARDWPEPNLTLLNAALAESGHAARPLTRTTWRRAVGRRLEQLDWSHVDRDVRPFLEDPGAADLLALESLLGLLRRDG